MMQSRKFTRPGKKWQVDSFLSSSVEWRETQRVSLVTCLHSNHVSVFLFVSFFIVVVKVGPEGIYLEQNQKRIKRITEPK